MPFLQLDPQKLSQREVHNYLLSAIAPRPICFASTVDAAGRPNLSPFSFFNVFSSNPPIVIFSPARRGRDNTIKHTLENVMEVPEVVVNVVTYSMVQQMSLSSADYDKGVNEFEKAGFTAISSDIVKPFRVKESPVNFECKVLEIKTFGEHPGAGNLIIAEVARIHINKKFLNDQAALDTEKLDLVARMGQQWYCRAHGDALFEVPKPNGTGIGVHALPENVQNSKVLTGNDLGLLGGIERIPDDATLETMLKDSFFKNILQSRGSIAEKEKKIHQLARQRIAENKIQEALTMLLYPLT